MKRYQPQEIEEKWKKKWSDQKIYDPSTPLKDEDKCYVLAEFAYPSGDLHVGHWFTFTGADIFARYKRLKGYNVFFPNGFDAFGLPAEGAAIKRNIHPKDWTLANIERMKEQYQTIGPSFSFKNEVITCLPEYYKWNQWIFLKMYEKGLAYRGKTLSNWCPFDQTVLANEAIEAGKCWRCGTEVVQKEIDQWFLKITDYADRLIWPENPEADWPESARIGQNSWIGKKEGINISYDIVDTEEKVTVFTTRPDTNFGATFVAVSPENPILKNIVTPEQKDEVDAYIEAAGKKTELERKENKEKTGVFTGAYALNQLTDYKMPIWVSDFVLAGYGTGALVGVPGHDQRDFEFASKFGIEVIRVVVGKDGDTTPVIKLEQVQESAGKMINSGFLDGLDIHEAISKILDHIVEKGWGEKTIQYHIHDWSISRQRYWGTPVPMIDCKSCGIVPEKYENLPVVLPYEVDYTPKGKPPLASNEEWLNVKCPKCGGDATRDPETLDTFFDSSWYFLRYIDPTFDDGPFPTDLANKIMPVDIYFGGGEHTLGHTLYARFFTRFFQDIGLLDPNITEFAARRIQHGIVLGPDGNKMSKSKGNVVNPDDEVKKYGTDAVRIHVAFFMPYDGVGPWISDRIWGPYRFIEKVWNLSTKVGNTNPTRQDLHLMHVAIKDVSEDIEAIKFNTAISSLMEWSNHLTKKDQVSKIEYETLLLLFAPFAPYVTEELWSELGHETSIHTDSWPLMNQEYLEAEEVNIVVQVNGKVRASMTVGSDIKNNQEEIEKIALANERVQKFLEGKEPEKIIFIPGKLISIISGASKSVL